MLYTLLVVTVVVFGVTQVLPGDAATMLLGENATAEQLAALRDRLGLNDPFWLQYLRWLGGAVRGDFGVSMRTGQLVLPVILEALSRSLLLAFFSIGLMLAVAIPLGIAAATHRGRLADITLGLFSYIGVSLPDAIPGIGRQIVVAIESRDLPMIQAGALMLAVTYATMNFVADLAYAMVDKRIQYG
jgi:peptide/nickel transport system permease protein